MRVARGQLRKAMGPVTSTLTQYFDRLQENKKDINAFNPTVVQTTTEFDDMVADIATRAPMVLRTVHLPPGWTMNDKRLRGKEFPIVRKNTKMLEEGEMPDLPPRTFIADLQKDLVPPRYETAQPTKTAYQRIQVIEPEYLQVAEFNGEHLLSIGRNELAKNPSLDVDEPSFSPCEVPESTVPHRRVSLTVNQACDNMFAAEKKRRGYF